MHEFRCIPLVVRRLWYKKARLLKVCSIALFVSAFLAGCVESSPRLERLFSLHIRTTDLPSGWYHDAGGRGDRDRENEGIVSRWVQFRGSRTKLAGVLVSQELIDYPDLDLATESYAEIAGQEFPAENWIWPEHIQFESKADQFRLACLAVEAIDGELDNVYAGMHHCTAVGRYGTLVSVIYANVFRDQWLTFDDLQRLLEAADARLADQP
jgi:hypothetical protein